VGFVGLGLGCDCDCEQGFCSSFGRWLLQQGCQKHCASHPLLEDYGFGFGFGSCCGLPSGSSQDYDPPS